MTGYGTSALKRDRYSNAKLRELDQAILGYVEHQHPITVRGVFYAMSVQGLIPKDDTGYRRVQRRVLELRRNGLLPYEYISDSTRWMRRPTTYAGLREMLADMQQSYRRDLWAEADVHVEVWCEKDALAGVLLEATAPWHVPLMVSRGFASDSYLWEVAEYLRQLDKRSYVYLFTDFDAAGLTIDTKIREGLSKFAPDVDIHFVRAGLTRSQIRDMDLPTRPPKPRDIAAGFEHCVDLDAIPPRTLIRMAERLILDHVDTDLWERTQAVEAAERETLRQYAQSLGAA